MPAFDTIAGLYDLLTDWGGRLDREIPFLNRKLESVGAKRVLDAACGTGVHLRALGRLGFEVAGSDVSPEMVSRTRERLSELGGVSVDVADFADAGDVGGPWDAVLVLGNSLPNAGGADRVRESLAGLARALRPGGTLVLHLLNYPRLIREGGGLHPLRRVLRNGAEYLFLKLFEIHREHVALNVIAIVADGGEHRQTLMRSTLFPLSLTWLEEELPSAGLTLDEVYGDFSCAPYDEENSGDLIVLASKTGGGNDG